MRPRVAGALTAAPMASAPAAAPAEPLETSNGRLFLPAACRAELNIGTAILHHLVITADLAGGAVWLEPGDHHQ